jgi:hypothetical protein
VRGLRIFVTEHTRKRLKDLRQAGIEIGDLTECALKIPGHIPVATRFRSFEAKSGKVFDLVVKDIDEGRLIITVVGKQ